MDRVADLRRHPQPVGPAAHAGRLLGRLRERDGRRALRRRDRVRRRRLDPHPRRLLRPVRAQAAERPRADRAGGPAVARHVDLGRDDARRRRQRARLRRDQGRRAVVRRGRRARARAADDRRLAQDAAADRPAGRRRAADRPERGRRGAARARARGGRARDRLPDHPGWQRALALPARDRRPGALDAAPRAPVAAHARLPADRLGDPGRAAEARQAGRRRGRAGTGRRGRRCRPDSDVHAPAAARGRVRRPPGGVDLLRLGALRALRRPVQPHRPAGGVGARGLDGRRLPGRRAARRAARRRAAAALALPRSSRARCGWTERRPAMAT